MQYYNYSENKQRGTFDFPFELYHVDSSHARYVMSYHWHYPHSGRLPSRNDGRERFYRRAGGYCLRKQRRPSFWRTSGLHLPVSGL